MSRYTQKDVPKERGTDTSRSKVSKAWHEAREHASKSGSLRERNASKTMHKTKDSSLGSALSKIFWGK